MLFEYVKNRIVRGLSEEIHELGAPELELVGHGVVCALEGQPLVHHGLNDDNRPVGYTVDSFSQDSAIVAEYSTEKGYFDDSSKKSDPCSFDKIENDVDHALKHAGSGALKKIYLVTSLSEPPSFRQKFNTTDVFLKNGEIISFLDAWELAENIYKRSVLNESDAMYYRGFFPDFAQNMDNYEYYGKVPARTENHVTEKEFVRSIVAHFKIQNVCVLCGLSGSGKTQAAVDFVHDQGGDFENYLWISGIDWVAGAPLSSIKRSRGGVPINVAGIFNASKTLLVIDDLARPLDPSDLSELEGGFRRGGKVLATSQISSPGNKIYLDIPLVTEEVALAILGEKLDSQSEACRRFVAACRFSPLILSTTRTIVELQGIERDDLYIDALAAPQDIASPDGTSIMRRILGRLEGQYQVALVKIANSGIAIHDAKFLNHFIGVHARVGLQRLSLLKLSNVPDMLAVHDFICDAVRTDLNDPNVVAALEAYIEKNSGEMTPSVLREVHLCGQKLHDEHARRADRRPDWLTYALLQLEGTARSAIHEALYNVSVLEAASLPEILCIVDAKETHAYTIENNEVRKAYYGACADQYLSALNCDVTEDIRAELLHHRGKALRRCDSLDEAIASFRQLLAIRPSWHAALGQIAHAGTQRGASDDIKAQGESALRQLLEMIRANAWEVPLRVSLAAISRLRSYSGILALVDAEHESVQMLADVIAMSALEGLDQFYEAFLAFTSMFGYHHGGICVSLAETLPEMLALSPDAVESRQWPSACESFTNCAVAADRLHKSLLKSQIAAAACGFADRLGETKSLNSFVARAVAKAYVTGEQPVKAMEIMSRFDVEKMDHWMLYQKSKAESAIDKRDDALATALKAYALAESDPKAAPRISIYLDQLSHCFEALGELGEAFDYAKRALRASNDDQYSEDLLQRQAALAVLIAARGKDA